MRCPRCHTETAADALACPHCKFPTPRGRLAKSAKKSKRKRDSGSSSGWLKLGIVIVMLVVVLGGGLYAYFFFIEDFRGGRGDPKVSMRAIEALRKMESNREGLTVDQRMNEELQKSREAGNLLRYQGWAIEPYDGTETKVLIVFSFEEKHGQRRAEWLADLNQLTFTPRTDLAFQVYSRGEQ